MEPKWKTRFGLVLIALSTLVFAFLLCIPWLEGSSTKKATITTLTVIVGEVLFWVGCFLVGKQLIQTYKSYFNPRNWLSCKRKHKQTEEDI